MKPSLEQNTMEKALQKSMALEIVKKYCSENNLSFKKLLSQRFELVYGTAVFAQESNVKPMGLTNDKETMPKPTLILTSKDNNIVIEQTEYTKQYLSE